MLHILDSNKLNFDISKLRHRPHAKAIPFTVTIM